MASATVLTGRNTGTVILTVRLLLLLVVHRSLIASVVSLMQEGLRELTFRVAVDRQYRVHNIYRYDRCSVTVRTVLRSSTVAYVLLCSTYDDVVQLHHYGNSTSG